MAPAPLKVRTEMYEAPEPTTRPGRPREESASGSAGRWPRASSTRSPPQRSGAEEQVDWMERSARPGTSCSWTRRASRWTGPPSWACDSIPPSTQSPSPSTTDFWRSGSATGDRATHGSPPCGCCCSTWAPPHTRTNHRCSPTEIGMTAARPPRRRVARGHERRSTPTRSDPPGTGVVRAGFPSEMNARRDSATT